MRDPGAGQQGCGMLFFCVIVLVLRARFFFLCRLWDVVVFLRTENNNPELACLSDPALDLPKPNHFPAAVPTALATMSRTCCAVGKSPRWNMLFGFLVLALVGQVLCPAVLASEVDDLRGFVDEMLTRIDRLEYANTQLAIENQQQQATIERQSKRIDSLEATASQQQVNMEQLRKEIDHQHVDNLVTKRDLSPLQSSLGRQRGPVLSNVDDSRRALSTTCEKPTGPRLLVEGVCSCQDDVLIGGRSVGEQLDNLTASVERLNSSVGELQQDSCDMVAHFDPRVLGSIVGDTVNLAGAGGVALSTDGVHAYVAARHKNAFVVLDVTTDPGNPAIVGSVVDNVYLNGVWGLEVSADGIFVYVSLWEGNGFGVVNVTDHTNPIVVGGIVGNSTQMRESHFLALAPRRDLLIVSAGGSDALVVVNVSDPTQPAVVGHLVDSLNLDGPRGVAVSPDGMLAFVASYSSSSFAVVNVTDATAPTLVGVVKNHLSLNGAMGVALSPDGQWAYVASWYTSGLVVVDVSDPTAPAVVGAAVGDTANMGLAYGVALWPRGNIVFVSGTSSDSVAAVDVSVPTKPNVVGAYTGDSVNLNGPHGLAVSPDGAFVLVTGYSSHSLAVLRFWHLFCA